MQKFVKDYELKGLSAEELQDTLWYDYAEKLKISKDNENLIILDCKYPRKENDEAELSKELVNNIFSKIEDICK